MTEASTDTTTPDPTPAVDAVSPIGDTPAEPSETSESENGNAEAAKYRRRLRDTETERDTLAERVQRMQRTDVERHVGDRLAVAADLFDVGSVNLDDLLDQDGNVDPGLVDTAVYGLLEARPGLGKTARLPKGPTVTGHHSGGATAGTAWSDVLQNPGKH